MPATYNDLYLDARKALKAAGVEQAQLEARELLCFASGKSREEFIRDRPLYASDGAGKRFRGLLERRRQEGNRKTIHLRLTEAAGPIVKEGRAIQREHGEILLSGFTGEERAELFRLLEKIGENVDAALRAAK